MTPIQQAIAILEEDALTNRIERALEVLRASQEDAPPPYFKYAQDISDRGGQPQRSKQRSCDLTKLAAECHRAKWQFDFSDENRLPISQARDMVKRAFGELHRIGDMALKLRDEPDTRPDGNRK